MNSTTLKSNEIDLLAIALALWAKRYILIVSTLSFVVAGILYARAQPIVYHGKVVINPLNEAELIGFNKWNQGISKAVLLDRGSVPGAMSNLNYSNLNNSKSLLQVCSINFSITTSEGRHLIDAAPAAKIKVSKACWSLR